MFYLVSQLVFITHSVMFGKFFLGFCLTTVKIGYNWQGSSVSKTSQKTAKDGVENCRKRHRKLSLCQKRGRKQLCSLRRKESIMFQRSTLRWFVDRLKTPHVRSPQDWLDTQITIFFID